MPLVVCFDISVEPLISKTACHTEAALLAWFTKQAIIFQRPEPVLCFLTAVAESAWF